MDLELASHADGLFPARDNVLEFCHEVRAVITQVYLAARVERYIVEPGLVRLGIPEKMMRLRPHRIALGGRAQEMGIETEGREAYCDYQITHEEDVLEPGVAFGLVRKLLSLNESETERVEVILLSRNSADTGLRVFNSIAHHQLPITRAASGPRW